MSAAWDGLLPDLWTGMAAAGVGLGVGGLLALWVGRLRRRGMVVPYTRKIYHFGVFTGAAGVHAAWGLPGTNAYGAAVALLVVVAVLRGDGTPFYEALARETDRPHRTVFILVPLFTTAVGGLVSALVAGPYATVGYLVGGWGDAVGEPVGQAVGRHPYRVPSLLGVPARRTVEGSAAVLAAGAGAAWVGLVLLGGAPAESLWVALACGGAGAAAEAVSHHGLDNLTVQIVAAVTALLLV